MSHGPGGSIQPLPTGFRASGRWAGIKREGRGSDLGLLLADTARPAAALFTRNALLGAHIPVCREHLARSGGLVRAIIVNSGNANCATGERGQDDARRTAAAVATAVGCPAEQVLPISTGAIGARLPMHRILAAIPDLVGAATGDGVGEFARAIMTTDTYPKIETATAGDGGARVTGIAKGAGMIHPDMATMLGFLLTDAQCDHQGDHQCPAEDLPAQCRRTADRSFHRISVDGDTSPNDTLVLWTGDVRTATAALSSALEQVSQSLCRQIAGDGEGATRLVTIEVRGARSEQDATQVGRLIATSPLVKTAIAGRDPNWGRILSTAGRAGVPLEIAATRVWIGAVTLFERGEPFPEREHEAWQHLNEHHDVVVGIDLGAGDAQADVWTCDLTADYVRINADYRT